MATFFTGDTHFGDPRALRIDRRPFLGLPAHDSGLLARWNEVVASGDEVWHLGDFALGLAEPAMAGLLARLHGRKHLILGNNDTRAAAALPGWASVRPYAEIEVDGVGLVLCHYAFRTWRNLGRGWLNLHGHSHGRLAPLPRQADVGVDAWGFRPVTLAEIRAARRRRRAKESAAPRGGAG